MSERLQKVLARAGLGSRRMLEIVIAEGRVTVNGKIAVLGTKISKSDLVTFDGRLVNIKRLFEQTRSVLIYNKPQGEVCTRYDPDGRPTIFDRLPKLATGRWIAVGRLDINTSGLLLLTSDGEMANRLMHPSSMIDREYLVRVHGDVRKEHIKRLMDGVFLEEGVARFTDIVRHSESNKDQQNSWFYVVLIEGKNREVRRLWESQGFQVNRLKRVRFGCIFLPSFLKQGQFFECGKKEVNDLCALVNLPVLPVPEMIPKQTKSEKRRLGKKPIIGKIQRSRQARYQAKPSRRGH